MIDIDKIYSTPKEICLDVAKNFKFQRKIQKYSQKEIALRSGVSYASLRRFEATGKIAFESLVKLAEILDLSEELHNLFTTRHYTSIQEIIDEENNKY